MSDAVYLHTDTESPAPALETRELRKVYGRKVAVEGLTLSVGRGEVFGFLGPNGAGKTTSIKMLMGLVRPTSGSATILGRPIGDRAVKGRLGFLPEHFRFHDWLQADEFLDWHGQLYGLPRAERAARIPEVLRLVGLEAESRARLRTYSKGMLQRVGLAQALLNRPDIVFLDEPTSALDPLGRRDVRDLISRLREAGVTVFLNSHLLSEVELVCDNVAIINHGRVLRQGPLTKLLSAQTEVELRVGGLDDHLLKELSSLCSWLTVTDGRVRASLPDEEDIPRVAEAVVRGGGRLYELTVKRSSLEDLFVRVIEEGSR